MMIHEMSREKCLQVLAGTRLARLACAHKNQPYVVPVYLVYHEAPGGAPYLYGFTTPGQKVEWMRANPLVCVEVDEVAAYDQWVSVIALGYYEELPEAPTCNDERLRTRERPRQSDRVPWTGEAVRDTWECDDERLRAWQILKTHPIWQEPGCTAWAARAHRDSAEPCIPVFYRVRIDHVTGHEATRDARDEISYAAPPPRTGSRGWLRRMLPRGFGGRSKSAGSIAREK